MTRNALNAAASFAERFEDSRFGTAIAEMMPIMATTRRSSISEKPSLNLGDLIVAVLRVSIEKSSSVLTRKKLRRRAIPPPHVAKRGGHLRSEACFRPAW